MRLARLVECAPGRLPVAVFAPGEWIAQQGERGKEVYMILEGEAEVSEAEPGSLLLPLLPIRLFYSYPLWCSSFLHGMLRDRVQEQHCS